MVAAVSGERAAPDRGDGTVGRSGTTAMVDFTDRKAIERWLAGIEPAKRRSGVAVALAARAALRVAPLLSAELRSRRAWAAILADFMLPSLRSAVSVNNAAARAIDAAARAIDATAAARVATAAANAAVHAVTATAYVTAHAARDSFFEDMAGHAAAAVGAAFDATAATTTEADARAENAPAQDAVFVDSGSSGAELAELPLWPAGTPHWAAHHWESLKAALLDANEGWEVWTNWYDARLAGDAGHPPNEALEIARATIPDEIWEQGPAVVNAEIKRLIAEHLGRALRGARTGFAAGSFGAPADTVMQRASNLVLNQAIPPIESIPEQERTGTRFGMDEHGRIDVVRTPPATDDLQRFHYDEMRHKAQALADLGQMLGDLAQAINRILEALPEHMEDASVDRLWSRANTLRRRQRAHVNAVESNLGPDPARLDALVAENLGDFIDTFNVYAVGDPRLLEFDRIRLGPQDREAVRKIVALAEPIASAVGEPESPVTPAAQETLVEQVSAAIDARNDIIGDQAAEVAQKTTGNFVTELLRIAYAVVTNEGKFAQKEIRAGLYRAAGTTAFGGLSLGAYVYWPAVSSFVVHHADALRAFVTEAYQNPKLVEIINLIVRAASH